MTPAPPIAAPDELGVECRVVVGPSEENDGRQRAQNTGESLWSRFRRTVLTHASRVAVCDSGSDYSYEELFRLTANLARLLLDAPVTLATPAPLTFGLLADEGLLVPVAKLAACAINAIVVPLDPTYPVERLVDMTRDCRLLVCDDRYAQVADRLFQKAATGCAAGITSYLRDPCIMVGIGRSAEACRAGLWSARNLTRLAKLLTADEKAAAEEKRADDHEEVRFFSLNAAAEEDDQKRLREASPTARDPIPLYLVYTSGSSGTPKAVLGTQFSLSRYLFDNSPVLQRFPGDRVLLCSAVTWDPSFSDVYGTLLSGATLGELCVYGDQVLSYSCANPVCRPSAEDQTRFYRVSGATFESMPGFRTGDRAEVHVLGEETPEAVAVQHDYAKSPGNSCHSYFVFEASRVIGFRVLDRMDRQVKLNGFRVELGEVESCLEEVASGCVCAKVEDFAIALRAFCESKLPRHAVPHRFVELVGPMPLTTSGKVDRKRVVAENLERATGRDSDLEQLERNRVTPASHEQLLHSIPTTATEKRLVGLWSELFAQPPSTVKIDLRSHFFECGGTSAIAVQMVRCLEEGRSALNPSREERRNASPGTSMKTNGHVAKRTGEEAAENAEMLHRKLCGLLRKPRLREYASFLDWADATSSTDQTNAPSASTSTESELLYSCLRVGDEKCLSVLLRSGAVDANGGFSKSFRGVTTPLLYILERSYGKDGEGERLVDERKRKRLVGSLIEHGADWTLGDAAGRTPFHLLARIPFATCAFVRGCFDSVLQRGEYPLSAGEGGPGSSSSPFGSTSTGASTAAIREHVKTLLLMPKDANKWNVLFYAVAAGNLALVKTLFKWASSSSQDDCPAKIRQGLFRLDAVDRWGKSVLHYAVENGDLGMTEFLLGFETTPLNYKPQQRAHRRRNDVLEYLPPLHTAVRKKDKKLVRLLLDSGAKVALNRDDQGRTALHEACAPALFFAVTKSGEEGNDDPPEPTKPGVPAHSFDEDSLEILEMLLKSSAAGADETTGAPSFIDAVDRELRSALFYLVPDDGIMIKGATELTTKVDDLASDTLEQPEADAEDHSALPLVRHEIERCDQQRQSKGRFGVAVDIRQEDHRQRKERSKKNQCFRCLEYGHAWKECPNKPKCRVCGLEHETKEHWKMLIAS
eukprot:g2521.t1